jgi:hypothetical protein
LTARNELPFAFTASCHGCKGHDFHKPDMDSMQAKSSRPSQIRR